MDHEAYLQLLKLKTIKKSNLKKERQMAAILLSTTRWRGCPARSLALLCLLCNQNGSCSCEIYFSPTAVRVAYSSDLAGLFK